MSDPPPTTPTTQKIRVLCVDDHEINHAGLARIAERESDLELVGVAFNGDQALALATELHPDVIVMDIRMGVMDGLTATHHLCTKLPQAKILILSQFHDQNLVFSALCAGAKGYILKESRNAAIAAAVRAVANGQTIFGPEIAAMIVEFFATRPDQIRRQLTPRELTALAHMVDGLSDDEVAAHMNVVVKTVQNYRTRILDVLQVADREQAISRAKSLGIFRTTDAGLA